ncbi:MAG: UDP-N-acetylmuramate dehydrogenase [Opitutae bacterium]|nr:UDP-N-acetylmuramate dehydrogenase [Opitutae bacterium]
MNRGNKENPRRRSLHQPATTNPAATTKKPATVVKPRTTTNPPTTNPISTTNPASRQRAWLLGICGMGVGPLAIYMSGEGWEVSGWDDAAESPMRTFLSAAGVKFSKIAPRNVSVVGRSSAVKTGNPLYAEAEKSGARLLRRGELLAERAATKKLIAVCGSHGKTTTSGILAQSLLAAGIDAGYVLGGLYRDAEMPPAHFSATTDWLVAEVDESDGTIKNFSPEICVPVNLDWDHPDYYKTEADLEKTFRDLFERTRRAVVIPAENERLARLTRGLKIPVYTVGAGGDFSARVVSAGAATTQVEIGGMFPAGTLELPLSGTFNTQNALLALAATVLVSGGKIGVSPLGKFSGMRRRQDVLYSGAHLKIFADYAHHPTEIAAFLRFLGETQLAKIVAVFQPHRYSRTRQYAAEFARALAIADKAFILPVYSAGEAHVPGGDTADIIATIPTTNTKIRACNNADAALAELRKIADNAFQHNDDVVIAFIGAGDIDRIAAAVFAKEMWLRSAESPATGQENFAATMRKELSAETTFCEGKSLAPLTTLGVGGNAKWFAEPATESDIEALLRGARVCGIPVAVIGNGSNLLVPDSGFDGLAIRLAGAAWGKISRVGDDKLRVGAGTPLKRLCAFAARECLGGFEFLDGIPGTLGGALRMNAGAHGNSIFDRVVAAEWLMPDGSRRSATREQLSPTYRDCPEFHGAIILSAVLRAEAPRPESEIVARQKAFAEIRKKSQPRERSAGCAFKNPPGDSAGRIIDSLGLKNSAVGKAKVSNVHANFITTGKGATAADVAELIRKIRGIVKAETGTLLVPEIVCLGKNWEL